MPKPQPVVHEAEPLNREWTATDRSGWLTPNTRFFDRNHFAYPTVRQDTWQLKIAGKVERARQWELWELLRMPAVTRWVTLECSGNKRAYFDPPAEGTPWRDGAVGNAEWTGIPLRTLLNRAGLQPGVTWIRFTGADAGRFKETGRWVHFERALPIDQALSPEVLLVYQMNGEPLPMERGGPLRLLVPHWYGMASVKWVMQIEARTEPFRGPFQVRDYVYLPAPGAYDRAQPVTLGKVNSLISEPAHNTEVRPGTVMVRGFAWSGAAPVAGVEVSLDGNTWQPAVLEEPVARLAWREWQVALTNVKPGSYTVYARASDQAGNVQPDKAAWNANGYGNNQIAKSRMVVTQRPTHRPV